MEVFRLKLCTLNITDNSCPYVSTDGRYCKAEDTKCAFSKEENIQAQTPAKYVRKPRWYEQYRK